MRSFLRNYIVNTNKSESICFGKPELILFIFIISTTILKIFLLQFVQYIDPDSVSRVFIANNWANNQYFIKSGNWGPVYFYIVGLFIMLFNEHYYLPIIINIIASSITVFVLFFVFTKIFSKNIALLICILYSLSPLIFRLSMQAMSETLFLLFLSLYVLNVIYGIFYNKYSFFIVAGLFSTIATGIRFENIIITIITSLLIIKFTKIKYMFVFLFVSLVFPLFWLITNYFDKGYVFNSFNWAVDAVSENKITSVESFFRRIWFFPMSFMFAVGPFGLAIFIITIFKKVTNKLKNYTLLLIVIIFIIILIGSLSGALLLQHRFVVLLYLLSLPIFGLYLISTNKNKILITFVIALSSLIFSYLYGNKDMRFIPQLRKTNDVLVNNYIKSNIKKSEGLIVDFCGWDNTYCWAFSSNLKTEKILIFKKEYSNSFFCDELKQFLVSNKQGKVIIDSSNRFNNLLRYNDKFIEVCNIKLYVKTVVKYSNYTILDYKSE